MDWRISKFEYLADLVLVPIYALVALTAALTFATPHGSWLVWVFVGHVIWTLNEYLMHRFLFHKHYNFEHAMHHRRPTDWIGISTFLMGPIFFGLWVAMVSLFDGIGRGGMVFVGYCWGYYVYVAVHLMIHHTNWPVVRQLRATHEMHHKGAGGNYGVSTNVWDHVFRTYLKPGV